MTEINWAQMATGVGDFLAVGMLALVFKAVFGVYWTNFLNRIVTLVLATAIPPLAIFALYETAGIARQEIFDRAADLRARAGKRWR